MKNIYLIVGESGAGKTTICNELERLYGLNPVASYTNRPRRYVGERGHTFLSAKQYPSFKEIEKDFNILAKTEFDGHCYFATVEQIENGDLYVVDPIGVENFRQHYTGPKGIRVIFVSVPENIRIQRMKKRGASIQEIAQRVYNDREAFSEAIRKSDFSTKNLYLNKCVEMIYSYIRLEESHESN